MLPDTIVVKGGSLPGMSGGPAIDARGMVVGVIEAGNGTTTYLTPATDVTDPPSGSGASSSSPHASSTPSPSSPSGFTPGDQNPNDARAAQCSRYFEIGPHSDCSVAHQVQQDVAQGRFSTPGSDTVSEGGTTITFNCSEIGTDTSGTPPLGIYYCVSQGDSQDWFRFEFT